MNQPRQGVEERGGSNRLSKRGGTQDFKRSSSKAGGGGHALGLMSQRAGRAVGHRGQRSGVRLGSQVARGAVGQPGEESCCGDEAGPIDGWQEVRRTASRSHHAQGVNGGAATPCASQQLLLHSDPSALPELLQAHLILPLPLGPVREGGTERQMGTKGLCFYFLQWIGEAQCSVVRVYV